MLPLRLAILFVVEVVLARPQPQNDESPLIQFMLYTRAHPKSSVHLAENASNLTMTDLNTSSSTVVIVHGYTEGHDSKTVQIIRDAYLHTSDFNVVVLNWWLLARGPHYEVAAKNTKEAGRSLANFLDNLIQGTQEEARRELHVVGFSLGAQVAGIAAGQLQTAKLPRITALDPAKPMFAIKDKEERLDAGDAAFVQVIHTASGFLSFLEPVGHADFYPNSGMAPQPACSGEDVLVCSHRMACTYFAESLYRPLSFPATLCDSWDNYKSGNCDGNTQVLMGANAPLSARGKFYLRTSSAAPYGQGNNTKTAEFPTTLSSNCSQNMTDFKADTSPCTETGPWTTVHHSVTKTEPPSVESHNNTEGSARVDRQLTAVGISVILSFVLLSCVFVFILVRYSGVVNGY